jgi:hypothetical protein
MTKEALAAFGGPDLVYIRTVRARDILADTPLSDDEGLDPNAIYYAVHAADGSRLAVLEDRKSAFAAARGNELSPVSVH